MFRARILTINFQLKPALHHNFTTKNPRPTTRFCKNPQQKQAPTTPQKLLQKRPSSSRVLASSEEAGGGHFVLAFEVEDLGTPQPAQTLRLRRMLQGCPKTLLPRSFSGERSFA